MGQKQLKILITGGLGYLGGRLSKAVVEEGRFSLRIGTHRPGRPVPDWLKRSEIVPIDLETGEGLGEACQRIDAIVHLASLNEIDSAADPEKALKVNSLGTLRLLRAALKGKIKRFIYLSTAHVYGTPLSGTITEATLPRPIHPYAMTHRAAEDWVLGAHQEGDLEGIVIRLSNSFGAPVTQDVNRWSLIVNDLCRQAVTTGKLTLRSAGLQRRDFIPLSDACRAILHLTQLPVSQLGDGLFNLSGDSPLQVIELAERIARRCQKILSIEPVINRPDPTPEDQALPLDYRMDKLKATGFELKGDFDSEIDETLRFCEKSFT